MAECTPKRKSSSSSGGDSISLELPTATSINNTPVEKNRIDDDNKMWVPIKNVNQYIICGICEGYLYEAATITECMHSFCKSCIVRHLERSLQCPTCQVIIHPTDPFVNLRLDRLLQDIVYGILPALYEEEIVRERKFYKENDAKPAPYQKRRDTPAALHYQQRCSTPRYVKAEPAAQPVYLALGCKCSSPVQKVLERRFVRVTGEATIRQVTLLIRQKLMLSDMDDIELFGSCSEGSVSLESNCTLSSVKAQHFGQEEFLQLEYEIRPWDWVQ